MTRVDKQKALRLRLQGKTYSDIQKSFSGILKWNKSQTATARRNAEDIKGHAIQDIGHISDREFVILAAALYWAEGYKRPRKILGREIISHDISVTNSDPKIIKAFLKCMIRACGIDISQVRVSLRIFPHINEHKAVKYWSTELGIPEANFTKTSRSISKSSMGMRPFDRLPYGVAQVRINSTDLFYKVMGWIEGLRKEF